MPQHFEILWIQTDWWFLVLVRYLSIAYNFTWILFIFSTAIGISKSMNTVDYGVSVYFIGYMAVPRVPVFWRVFSVMP